MHKQEEEKIELDSVFVKTVQDLNSLSPDAGVQYLGKYKAQVERDAINSYKNQAKLKSENRKRTFTLFGVISIIVAAVVLIPFSCSTYNSNLDKKAVSMGLHELNVSTDWYPSNSTPGLQYKNLKVTVESGLFNQTNVISMEIKSDQGIKAGEFIPISVTLYKHGLDVIKTQGIHINGPLPPNTTATIKAPEQGSDSSSEAYYASVD